MKTKTKRLLCIAIPILLFFGIYILYRFNYIPHQKYTNEDFGIAAYVSKNDQDQDGTDDQADILNCPEDDAVE